MVSGDGDEGVTDEREKRLLSFTSPSWREGAARRTSLPQRDTCACGVAWGRVESR